jgi:hypothetical protein
MLGVLDQFCPSIVPVTPLKTLSGLLILLLQSHSHVATFTPNYFLRRYARTQLTITYTFVITVTYYTLLTLLLYRCSQSIDSPACSLTQLRNPSLKCTHADGIADTSCNHLYSLVAISLLRKWLRCVWNVGYWICNQLLNSSVYNLFSGSTDSEMYSLLRIWNS